MSLIKELKAGKLAVKIFSSRKALGETAARECAGRIKELLQEKDEINIIFGAAPSQNEFIEALAGDPEIPWEKINGFHMDEYIGLPADAPQRLAAYLQERLFSKVNFKSVHYIDGTAEDVEAECNRYGKLLQQYPVDIVCMGIGENGHIAFNDPHVALFNDPLAVKVIEPDEKCRRQQVNDGNFPSVEDVPVQAITLTIPTMLAARYIFCMVPDIRKAEAVYNSVKGEVQEACPASILQTHENAVLYLDKDSASKLL